VLSDTPWRLRETKAVPGSVVVVALCIALLIDGTPRSIVYAGADLVVIDRSVEHHNTVFSWLRVNRPISTPSSTAACGTSWTSVYDRPGRGRQRRAGPVGWLC
jgi:hypothetical protein